MIILAMKHLRSCGFSRNDLREMSADTIIRHVLASLPAGMMEVTLILGWVMPLPPKPKPEPKRRKNMAKPIRRRVAKRFKTVVHGEIQVSPEYLASKKRRNKYER